MTRESPQSSKHEENPSIRDERDYIRVERGPAPPPDLTSDELDMYFENYFADMLGFTLPYPNFARYHAIMACHRAASSSSDAFRNTATRKLALKSTKRK